MRWRILDPMESEEKCEALGEQGLELIYDICEVAKYRLPGSDQESKAQDYIQEKMNTFGADEIETHEFYTHAKFFKWWPRLSLFFYIISLIVFPFSPLLTIVFILLMVSNIILKLFSYTFFDVLFKKHPSRNVIGKIKPKNPGELGKSKRILILGGHIDSTYEFPLGRKYGKKMIRFYAFVFIMALIWFMMALIQLIFDIVSGYGVFKIGEQITIGWYYWVIVAITPFIVWIAWNVVSSRPVQGANDNLSGIAVVTAALKYFSEHRPQNLGLWIVSFGSEEGGMAGSKALSKKLKQQMEKKEFSAESLWVINFDSIAQNVPLIIATAEPMYRVKSHDPKVYNALARAAEKAGVDSILKKIDAGTDSAPFSRLGIPSVGVIAAGKDGIPKNWHSREDVPEGCEVEGITNAIKIAIEFIKEIDTSLE